MSAHFVSLKGDRDANEDCHNIILGMDDHDNHDNHNNHNNHNNQDNQDNRHNQDNHDNQNNKNNLDNTAKVNYYGIYDGHGGSFVSKFLSNNLPQFFISKGVTYPLDVAYVNKIYDEIQKTLFTKHKKESTECGSTCLVVCHFKDANGQEYINVMNTGDCRSVMCRGGIATPLTLDHKPDWPYEKSRILKLGGKITKKKNSDTYRIDDLSVSRAFGDLSSSKYVTHRPDVYKYKLTKQDKFIIIACDGLWDVMSSYDAVDYVLKNCYDTDMKRINQKVNISRKLAETAIIDLDCGDNVTCIVVFFD